MQQVRLINKRDGNVVTNEESVLKGWKEKIRGERGAEEVETVEQEVRKISTDEEKSFEDEKAVGHDDIQVEVWKCIRERAVDF